MSKNIKQKTISALILAILLIVSLQLSVFSKDKKGGDLFVYYLNVGQGDSALIEAPNGVQVMIDAGRNNEAIKELDKILPFWDRYIDVIVLSHGDMDHIGGFFEILDTYDVGEVVRSTTVVDSDYEKKLLDKATQLGINIAELKIGDKIILDQTNNIYIETYWPPLRRGFSGQAPKENLIDENETSLVMELIHGKNEFLFTGDATIGTEAKLIEMFPEKIDTDILKVGHHGSKTSTSQLFLDKTTPDYSILSYGKNSYGHPNPEVLERLEQSGGKVFHTKDRATIVARSNGKVLEVNYLNSLLNQTSFLQGLISTIFINSFNTSS